MRLESSFSDYYDSFFSKDAGPVFIRRPDHGPSKIEALQMLNSIGLKTPRYGPVEKVINQLRQEAYFSGDSLDSLYVVVYVDQYSHHGSGKVKIKASEALRYYKNYLCSEFLDSPKAGYPASLKYLQVGNRRWWVRYVNISENPKEWRSNAGKAVEVRVIEEIKEKAYHYKIKDGLFSIDFIPTMPMLAVDFNLNPRLCGTGIEELLAPGNAFRLIRDANKYFNPHEFE